MGITHTPKERVYMGQSYRDVVDLPNLIDIQTKSYANFLDQKEAEEQGRNLSGLEEVFRSIFPIESSSGELVLECESFRLDRENIEFSEKDAKRKGQTHSVPLRALVNLQFVHTGEIRQKEIYMGDIPLMTPRGTFIINGSERVVVSQLHRSPGVIFSHEKGLFYSRIIPYRGSWLEFEIESKKEVLYVKIDRRKKAILGTLFLRALGCDTREKILESFYKLETITLSDDKEVRATLHKRYLARSLFDAQQQLVFRAGDQLHSYDIEDLYSRGFRELVLIDLNLSEADQEIYLSSEVLLNTLAKEDSYFVSDNGIGPSRIDAVSYIYRVLLFNEIVSLEVAERELHAMFFSLRRYDLGAVGRYRLDKKFNKNNENRQVLSLDDIIATMSHLMKVYEGQEMVDDIDHLGNRRVRSVGEMFTNTLKTAFSRMERIVKERMATYEYEGLKPQELLSIKPVLSAIKEFFGTSQLSQFMDQVNPLAELTHKRRLNALGPGGLSRDRAGFEVRDVHYSHYGRMCPIETPEGANIGLIVSLATYARVNRYGFLETPYRKVVKGRVSDTVEYLSAIEEEKCYIAQANALIDEEGHFLEKAVSVRRSGDYIMRDPKNIQYMDVSPKQVVSLSSALIPFLEHDDANRALMGSNMQRQAVPLLFPEPPIVGTGMERKAALDSGVVLKARRAGRVVDVSSTYVVIQPHEAPSEQDYYELIKNERTNQDTCFNQRTVVLLGQELEAGAILADGPSTFHGELALGRNLLVGFVPWNGYNYEDAILISERVVKEDIFTSVHIREFTIEIRETKLGSEKVTSDIPNVSAQMLRNLDENGIVRIGAVVGPGDILIGKVTPKTEHDVSPEFKLLSSIFGDRAKEVKDNSLRVPHGTDGTVIDVHCLSRESGIDLSPGVEEVYKVYVAKKSKLKEGDKMAGRHGNKGVVARILPEENMPYMADGTPLDICLNPLGVPSRMNLGQLLESQLGFAGYALHENYASPVFQSTKLEDIQKKLKQGNIPETSKITLYDGHTGEAFENPVMVGVMYMLKLHHLVDDKMHARSTGPYSLVTQQPLGGRAHFGGQRLGEMEVWALEAYGASHILQELLTVKSDDMTGRTKLYEGLVKGQDLSVAGIPESFNVLIQELRSLCLDVSIYDLRGDRVALTERDEELTKRRESQF